MLNELPHAWPRSFRRTRSGSEVPATPNPPCLDSGTVALALLTLSVERQVRRLLGGRHKVHMRPDLVFRKDGQVALLGETVARRASRPG